MFYTCVDMFHVQRQNMFNMSCTINQIIVFCEGNYLPGVLVLMVGLYYFHGGLVLFSLGFSQGFRNF